MVLQLWVLWYYPEATTVERNASSPTLDLAHESTDRKCPWPSFGNAFDATPHERDEKRKTSLEVASTFKFR
ncbi:hypothetical protein J6590_006795 [Homalodisca vitripennis]|nr:hypothetical protein J6590_006795 [Homalodisca vitripennis]